MTRNEIEGVITELQHCLGLENVGIEVRFVPDEGDTLCSVAQANGGVSRQRWTFRIYDSAARETPENLYWLICHEFGHILTGTELDDAQAVCKSVVTEEDKRVVDSAFARANEYVAEAIAASLTSILPLTDILPISERADDAR